MHPSLPSRYEYLEEAFRGHLKANKNLNDAIINAEKAMKISGGIRFLPIYGPSGSGKTCAALEIDKHLPDTHVFLLERDEIEDGTALKNRILKEKPLAKSRVLIAVVDQFEELVSGKEAIPTQFIERLSILDRKDFKNLPIIFLWLTTNLDFQKRLEQATTRNSKLLMQKGFSIEGPSKDDWREIINATFSFHNGNKPLSDYGIVDQDIDSICSIHNTIGDALEAVAALLGRKIPSLQNISDYRIILVWPVAEGARTQRVLQFTRPREGYLLNWESWVRELNKEDRSTLPLGEYNRTRLYFDMRLVPLRVADIHKLCGDLDNDSEELAKTYLERFRKTHLFHIISGNWESYEYDPLRERESKRADEAALWYESVTSKPTLLGRRIARVLKELGEDAKYEKEIESRHARVKADVYVEQSKRNDKKQIIELKVFSSENTVPSAIKDQIRITLKRHAQFAGFLPRQ